MSFVATKTSIQLSSRTTPSAPTKERLPGSDRNAGNLSAQRDHLVKVIIAVAAPGNAKLRIDGEERLAVGPQPADMNPRVAHWLNWPTPVSGCSLVGLLAGKGTTSRTTNTAGESAGQLLRPNYPE